MTDKIMITVMMIRRMVIRMMSVMMIRMRMMEMMMMMMIVMMMMMFISFKSYKYTYTYIAGTDLRLDSIIQLASSVAEIPFGSVALIGYPFNDYNGFPYGSNNSSSSSINGR